MKTAILKGTYVSDTDDNFWKRQVLFRAINHVLCTGYCRQLELSDLPLLPTKMKSINSLNLLQHCAITRASRLKISWIEHPDSDISKKALWSILFLLWRAHGGKFLVLGFLKILMLASSFAGPLLLSMMVTYLDSSPTRDRLVEGLLLVFGLGCSFVFSAIVNTQFNIRSSLLQVRIKGAMTSAVFARALNLPLYAYTDLDLTGGKMTTLIQIDVDRVSGCAGTMHDLWMLPIQIAITLVLLYQQVQSAFLAGLCIIIIMFPINKTITTRIMAATKGQMACKDKRVTLTSESLRGIRSVKMLGLEASVSELSASRRKDELKYLSTRKYLDACCVFLWASLPVLVPFSTFAVSSCLLHRQLSVSEVFTTIALLNMLIFPMNAFPWVLNGCVEAGVSLSRVAKVLSDSEGRMSLGVPEPDELEPEFSNDCDCDDISSDDDQREVLGSDTWTTIRSPFASSNTPVKALLVLRAAQFGWSPIPFPPLPHQAARCCFRRAPEDLEQALEQPEPLFSLPPLSFSGAAGHIIPLVGAVASGKSTLLLGILGEMRMTGALPGDVLVQDFRISQQCLTSEGVAIAFCPQVPVMHCGSIRSNIMFGSAMEPGRYRAVLKGCGFMADMANGSLPRGDLTLVGHSGGALSGGQRLRVGVARALYSKAKVVLLDSPFSALDHATSVGMLKWMVREISMQGRMLLLASHSVALLRGQCKNVMLLRRGSELQQGPFEDLERSSTAFQELLGREPQLPATSTVDIGTSTFTIDDNGASMDHSFKVPTNDDIVESKEEVDPIEAMATGRIGNQVYLTYFRAAGHGVCMLVVLVTLAMEVSSNCMSLYYAYWAQHSSDISSDQFLLTTGSIAGANVLLALIRSFVFAFGGLQAAKKFYSSLTSSVLSTDLDFFERTSIGRILNRFGKDTDTIDDQLPFMLNIVLAQTCMLLGSFVVISYTNPPILVVLALVGGLYWRLQNFYRATSRGIRRLDAIKRSPVYTILQDCLANATTIRAMRRSTFFRRQLSAALDRMLQVQLTSAVISQWLNIRLQLMGALISSSIGLLSTIGSATGLLPVSPALMGVSLLYSLSLVNKLNGLVGSLTETEQEMVSVERCAEYLALRCEFEEPISAGLEGTAGLNKANGCGRDRRVANNIDARNEQDVDALKAPLLQCNSSSDVDSVDAPVLTSAESLASWPAAGEIVFRNVFMRYESGAQDALDNLSLHVAAGSRVAVVGRTGSGKSTLLRVLLRLNSYSSGSIQIDGIEVSSVPKSLLRERISVIPQDPFLLSGPVRLSLDPWQCHEESALAHALIDCGFLDTMNSSTGSASGGVADKQRVAHELLDYELVDGGSNLSLGQRQLLCLGRAILRGAKIVILDEFSSSVDSQAEALLYELLERSVSRTQSTLIVITHREPPKSCECIVTMSRGTISSVTTK